MADLLVVVGLVWLGTSLVASLTLTYADLGWWLGHMFELDGILIVGIPVALDLAHTAQSRPLAGDLHAADLVAVRRGLPRLARPRDHAPARPEGRVHRAAHAAGRAPRRTGRRAARALASRLRALAIGGLVHDIGKLSVPDSILKKPGPLDGDEYEIVKRHAEWGAKLIDELGGFSESVRRLVRDHHERLDGNGYPAGLTPTTFPSTPGS